MAEQHKPQQALANARVSYTSKGRSGTVHYASLEASFDMWYEFAGGNAIAIINIPTREQWEAWTRLPLSQRSQVLEYIGKQVLKDQVASGGYFEIDDNFITIYSSRKN